MTVANASMESDVLSRVIAPEKPDLSPEAARALLALCFDKGDLRRMDELAQKARSGTLTAEQQAEAEAYKRIGHFLSLLKSKARLSLSHVRAGESG